MLQPSLSTPNLNSFALLKSHVRPISDSGSHLAPCRLIKESVSHWGTVDVLVNNAGITRDTLIMRMKPEQWQSVIDTNLSAVFYASQVTWPSPSPGSLTRISLFIP